jgi:hypothetical protein
VRGTLTGSLTYGRGIWRTDIANLPALAATGCSFPELGGAEPSLVVLTSAPSRNNPVRGGVLLTGAAGEMPAGWVSGQSRQSRLRSRHPGSWAMAR